MAPNKKTGKRRASEGRKMLASMDNMEEMGKCGRARDYSLGHSKSKCCSDVVPQCCSLLSMVLT